jgi:DNA-binding transcriptional regulator GbsR (MarR family)
LKNLDKLLERLEKLTQQEHWDFFLEDDIRRLNRKCDEWQDDYILLQRKLERIALDESRNKG